MRSNYHSKGKTKELRNTESNFDREVNAVEEMNNIDENEQARDDNGSPPPSKCSVTAKAKTKFKKQDVQCALIDFMESHKASEKPFENDDLAFFYSPTSVSSIFKYGTKICIQNENNAALARLTK